MICFWHLFFVLVWLSVLEPAEARRARYRPQPPKPKPSPEDKAIEDLAPGQNININQMSGKWYLTTVASRCMNLAENAYKLESTVVIVNVTDKVSTSTLRKYNYECWEVKQDYLTTKTPGRLLLRGRTPAENVDVFVVETDYSSYAVLVFKRAGKITMKLYGRSPELPEDVVDKFEERAKTYKLGLDVVFTFQDYGFCQSADKVLVMP